MYININTSTEVLLLIWIYHFLIHVNSRDITLDWFLYIFSYILQDNGNKAIEEYIVCNVRGENPG